MKELLAGGHHPIFPGPIFLINAVEVPPMRDRYNTVWSRKEKLRSREVSVYTPYTGPVCASQV